MGGCLCPEAQRLREENLALKEENQRLRNILFGNGRAAAEADLTTLAECGLSTQPPVKETP